MNVVFGILTIAAAVLLIFIVLIQNSKGGGLSNAFGAQNLTSVIGTRRASQDIEKYTWYLLAGLLFFAFLTNVTFSTRTVATGDSFESLLNAPSAAAAQQQQAGEDAGAGETGE